LIEVKAELLHFAPNGQNCLRT